MFDSILGVLALLVALLILDIAALRFGADSRTPVLLGYSHRRDL